MPITPQQLLQILPNAVGAKRVAAFIALIGYKSGQLVYVREMCGP
jgi:hypothetical protein